MAITLPKGVASIKVELLGSPEGAGAKGDSITYAGSQWTYDSLGEEVKGVRNDSIVLKVNKRLVYLEVFESSAVLIHLSPYYGQHIDPCYSKIVSPKG